MTTPQLPHILCTDSYPRTNIEVMHTTPTLLRTMKNNKNAVTRRKKYRDRQSTEKAQQRSSKSAYMRVYMREYRARKNRQFAAKPRHLLEIGEIEQKANATAITKVRTSTSIKPLERREHRRPIQPVREEVDQIKVVPEANKVADTRSTNEKWADENPSATIPMIVYSDENEDDHTNVVNENQLARLVRAKKQQSTNMDLNTANKKRENLLQTSVVTNKVIRPPPSYDWVCQLVKTQLDYLEDPVIRNDTIWAIQCALRKGIERQDAINNLNRGNYRNESIYKANNNLRYIEDTDSQSDPSIPESSLAIDIVNIPLNIKEESM